MGNWLSDKYAEGVPRRRTYAGREVVDQIEMLAADHARALFDAEFAYVQPHSGRPLVRALGSSAARGVARSRWAGQDSALADGDPPRSRPGAPVAAATTSLPTRDVGEQPGVNCACCKRR